MNLSGYAPASKDSLGNGSTLLHRDCEGGEVRWDYYQSLWCCAGCRARWGAFWFKRYSDKDMADRFVVKPTPDPREYTLVWKRGDCGRNYATAVPVTEAGELERVKV